MKKILVLMSCILCAVLLGGCGNKTANEGMDESVVAEENMTENGVMEGETEEFVTENIPTQTYNMTREEVIETYFKPMEELKSEYEASTEPDEIERIAKEYNVLATEGRLAYIEATGEEPVSDFISRREYLMKAAYYRVVVDYASKYDDMYVSYTEDEGEDENGNPFPTNTVTHLEDGTEFINPEASDSVTVLVKNESVNDKETVAGFMIIKDGGRTTLEVEVADYTDEPIYYIDVDGDYVYLHKSFSGDYIVYKYVGDSLEYIGEYFDFENHQPTYYGYIFECIDNKYTDINEEVLQMAENLL